jgi:hypothetical protein
VQGYGADHAKVDFGKNQQPSQTRQKERDAPAEGE